MILSTAFVFSSLLLGTNAAIGPAADLQIVNKHISPDGFSRSTVLAGGTFPGPVIKGNKGDRFLLNVEDKLSDTTMLTDTSIHWHGFFQKGTNWADGPSWVTQCPITPERSFLYDFEVPSQAGTFWYHSHLSTQYCDGLRGAMVVYDPKDPQRHLYDIDDDSTVITLADWYHYPALQQPAGRPATFNSTLINGLGRYQNGPLSNLAVINVSHGKRYRFRLVSISCDPNFNFTIDGHQMTIIEVDGVNHQPLTVDSIQIFAGQRYSFVLNANQPVSNYWVRAQPNSGNTGFVNATNSAILRYAGASTCDPTTSSTSKQPLLETALHPLVPSIVPGKHVRGGADKNFVFNITVDPATGRFLINGTTFTNPSVPVLLQILSGAHTAQELMPKGNNVYELKPNQVVEISIIGGSLGAPHPFHLHGHNFYVVRSAGNSTYNWDNPVIRDVVTTGSSANDLTTFRFVTDNAGPWFLHCHIDWHLDAGLALVFAENIPAIGKENPPVSWDQLCPTYHHVHPNSTASLMV
ncbi:laccase 2 precursor [Mycena alexandri]|uniref:Laccase 2 n=1 Tax=Mycena alexandri TaxID=1745969 RepID=A0AAD6TGH1_9AGAR|nr:laccase 2 precursor [Mycena alexandri]